jgi:hypothetical protein
MIENIPRGEAMRFGWEMTKENLGFFIASYIVAGLVWCVSGVLLILTVAHAADGNAGTAALFGLLTFLVSTITAAIMFVSYVKAGMFISAGYDVSIRDCLPTVGEIAKVYAAYFIWFVGIGIGLVFFILPGIWVALKYWPCGWIIIEKGLGPVEALKEAGELTDLLKFDLMFFFIVCGLVLFLGALVFLVGILIAFPVVLIATTYVFRLMANLEVAS